MPGLVLRNAHIRQRTNQSTRNCAETCATQGASKCRGNRTCREDGADPWNRKSRKAGQKTTDTA
jgi:hypothetical protein